MNTQEAPYGFCPKCGAKGITRERRPNGNDKCANGHQYPSKNAVQKGELKAASKLSDFRLNKELAEALGYTNESSKTKEREGTLIFEEFVRILGPVWRAFDYRNWNDLMPLVVEYSKRGWFRVSKWGTGGFNAQISTGKRKFECVSAKTELRALAECLLKVLQDGER